MRPEILFPLFAPVTSLKGVGQRIATLLEKAAGPKVVDLLWHLPREVIDRSEEPTIQAALPDRIATITAHVDRHEVPPTRKRPYRVLLRDGTGFMTLVFFHADQRYMANLLPEGEQVVVSGRIELFNGVKQIVHPDHVVPVAKRGDIPMVEPVYPLTAGLTGNSVRKAVTQALERAPDLPEWLDESYRARQGWPGWREALTAAHAPSAEGALSPLSKARQRLAFDELLANQLALAIMRRRAKRQAGREIAGDKRLRRKALAALPFDLTGSQIEALKEINADMAAKQRMLRLLQGDVGSGKTVVALMAMLNAVECGGQAALMAPTEILARQHFETIGPLAEAAGIRVAVLTGRDKGKARRALLESLAAGEIDLIVGTHALFQDDVIFRDLMLAVVDEQHRFGVHQRLNLAAKGKAVDMLVMTATPIPRTLMMSAYGDLDGSRLTDKPPGRKPVRTVVVAAPRIEEVVAGIERQMTAGAKIYWVCPLVEESETSDMAAAEQRFSALRERFGETRVALVHGRMKGTEKEAAMARFAEGEAQILVATTVIEVGVNVPEATVMVIEHAERFGLAQLHQLRGRIGRGDKASTCILLRSEQLTETARERLKTLAETEDGFIIAEKDLELRGAGEILGTRQSGLPAFRLADIALHGELMKAAHDDSRLILDRDPELEGERGKRLRTLLYLFERDAAIATLRSG
ncbi:ATP-dependent DNA helicase RecG [Marivibrio halodurans]|uniref:ATP-dependent DNA helicase RecG n=1 Tax=Marivibrio halodurans TaxID=2039722 RepID=A0A8J7V0Y7_9PROT|nr:ATP-dependent DNA helicase RecG [Marivibrio halodurans]MBP5855551.1 ATP-dependent DNA helicase RecG [Marivibrio halodurans]